MLALRLVDGIHPLLPMLLSLLRIYVGFMFDDIIKIIPTPFWRVYRVVEATTHTFLRAARQDPPITTSNTCAQPPKKAKTTVRTIGAFASSPLNIGVGDELTGTGVLHTCRTGVVLIPPSVVVVGVVVSSLLSVLFPYSGSMVRARMATLPTTERINQTVLI